MAHDDHPLARVLESVPDEVREDPIEPVGVDERLREALRDRVLDAGDVEDAVGGLEQLRDEPAQRDLLPG